MEGTDEVVALGSNEAFHVMDEVDRIPDEVRIGIQTWPPSGSRLFHRAQTRQARWEGVCLPTNKMACTNEQA